MRAPLNRRAGAEPHDEAGIGSGLEEEGSVLVLALNLELVAHDGAAGEAVDELERLLALGDLDVDGSDNSTGSGTVEVDDVDLARAALGDREAGGERDNELAGADRFRWDLEADLVHNLCWGVDGLG